VKNTLRCSAGLLFYRWNTESGQLIIVSMRGLILIAFVVFIAAVLFFIGCAWLSFAGVFDKKYSREWLAENFVRNENAFSELATIFDADVSKSKHDNVSLGLSNGDRISLVIYPDVIDPANKIIGGDDLKLGSPELDSTLVILGWTIKTVKDLRDRLKKTNCDWIRVIARGNPIEMYPNQTGWGSFSYTIFKDPIPDSLFERYGKPLSDSGFGRRVELDYTSVL
jgi:hypothetical protein